MASDTYLSQTDLAVLKVLVESPDRIVGRETIVRRAGLDSVSMRRADASIVVLRRILGADSIITVRRRGWMLAAEFQAQATSLMDTPIELT
jgi:DNA-binding winged helix-turn-helix (wHTH) protein